MTKRDRLHRYDISTDHRLDAVRRRCVAWVGLLLIAFNILGSAALPIRAEASSLSPAQAFDRIEICTSAGMAVMDRDGNIVPSDGSAQSGQICPFCLPLARAGAAIVDAVGIPVPAPPSATPNDQPAALATFRPTAIARSASPRAPPLS